MVNENRPLNCFEKCPFNWQLLASISICAIVGDQNDRSIVSRSKEIEPRNRHHTKDAVAALADPHHARRNDWRTASLLRGGAVSAGIGREQSALGCALARAGHLHAAREYLQMAVAEMPCDQQVAWAYYQVLHDIGMRIEARCFAEERKVLQAAHPEQLPVESWFADVERTGAELTSILIPCHNQWHYTEACLQISS
ncbi:MAG: hypothetical protein R3B84_08680 [Zavarzinella sp.]